MIKDIVYYQSSRNMANVENESVQLIITSPPYFNIKNYSEDLKELRVRKDRFVKAIGQCQNKYNTATDAFTEYTLTL